MGEVESVPATAAVPQQRQREEPAQVPPVVQEFLLIHNAMRHAAGLLVEVGQALQPGPGARATALSKYVTNLLVFIHHHHTGEDEHWWPSLRERSAAAGEVLTPLTDDHHALDPLLAALRAHAGRLRAGTHVPADFRRDAVLLRDHLLEHLAAEEPVLFPLLARHMEPAEAARLGRLMAKSAPKTGLSYLLGAMNATATEQEQQVVLRKMPPPVRWLRPRLLRSYARNVAVLTGS